MPTSSFLMRKAILITFAVVAAAVVLPFVAMLALETVDTVTGGCSEGEMRVFREFPQYGGRQLEPEYSGSNGCFVTFTTEDPPERVLAHYKQELTGRGWTLDRPPPPSKPRRDKPRAEVLARPGAATGTRPYWSRPRGTGRRLWSTSSRGTSAEPAERSHSACHEKVVGPSLIAPQNPLETAGFGVLGCVLPAIAGGVASRWPSLWITGNARL